MWYHAGKTFKYTDTAYVYMDIKDKCKMYACEHVLF